MIEHHIPALIQALTTRGGTGLTMLVLGIPSLLKLIGAIDWPWIWALAPFWILFLSLAAIGALVAIFAIGYLLFTWVFR